MRYGFVEYDGPTLEAGELYRKKNEEGAEILEQLYAFTDRGGREVALRPEMTPTLARMVASREKHYRKPMKWFCVSNFFRHERQQKGRLREFLQFNADIVGENSPESDAEIVALAIDLLRSFGFSEEHFIVRLSDRRAWMHFLQERGCPAEGIPAVLACADKLERDDPAALDTKLAPFGLDTAALKTFIAGGSPEAFAPLLTLLEARGLRGFVEPDLSIVRGLAYYTGLVFEIFDRSRSLRALAGGGRYDNLIGGLSDGAVELPAIGFGMGDVVLGHLIDEVPAAAALRPPVSSCELYIVVADETRRAEALAMAQLARDSGWRTDLPLRACKVGRQFQDAEQSGARYALVVGAEWPQVRWKTLADRTEVTLDQSALAARLKTVETPRLS